MAVIWNSYSKSATARRPRTMIVAPDLLGRSASAGVSKGGPRSRPRRRAGRSRPRPGRTRSSRVNIGPLSALIGHADHQLVDQLHRPADDVEVAVGDRVEGAGIEADRASSLRPSLTPPVSSSASLVRASSSPSSPPLSASRSTETTCSSSAVRKTMTPWVLRAAMRIWPTGHADQLALVGDQQDLVALLHREGGDQPAALAGQVLGQQALAAAAGAAVVVGRGALADSLRTTGSG